MLVSLVLDLRIVQETCLGTQSVSHDSDLYTRGQRGVISYVQGRSSRGQRSDLGSTHDDALVRRFVRSIGGRRLTEQQLLWVSITLSHSELALWNR